MAGHDGAGEGRFGLRLPRGGCRRCRTADERDRHAPRSLFRSDRPRLRRGLLQLVKADQLAGLDFFVFYLALPALFIQLIAATPTGFVRGMVVRRHNDLRHLLRLRDRVLDRRPDQRRQRARSDHPGSRRLLLEYRLSRAGARHRCVWLDGRRPHGADLHLRQRAALRHRATDDGAWRHGPHRRCQARRGDRAPDLSQPAHHCDSVRVCHRAAATSRFPRPLDALLSLVAGAAAPGALFVAWRAVSRSVRWRGCRRKCRSWSA